MGKLFDKHVRLSEGFVYERDAYDRRPGCDPEIIAQGLAPVTDIERCGMAKLSAVDVELLTHKLSAVVEEARDVYMSLSISEGIITGDTNCGLYHGHLHVLRKSAKVDNLHRVVACPFPVDGVDGIAHCCCPFCAMARSIARTMKLLRLMCWPSALALALS